MDSPLVGRRIMIVEDEIMVAWVLEDMLADLGCHIVGPATRVSQALALLGVEEIDAAVLDVNLCGQRSYPVADALATRGVPFIFSTGYQKDSLPNGYKILPMLQKPFGQANLRDVLISLLKVTARVADFLSAQPP